MVCPQQQNFAAKEKTKTANEVDWVGGAQASWLELLLPNGENNWCVTN